MRVFVGCGDEDEEDAPGGGGGALGFWTREPVRTRINIGVFTIWTREPLVNIEQLRGAWR